MNRYNYCYCYFRAGSVRFISENGPFHRQHHVSKKSQTYRHHAGNSTRLPTYNDPSTSMHKQSTKYCVSSRKEHTNSHRVQNDKHELQSENEPKNRKQIAKRLPNAEPYNGLNGHPESRNLPSQGGTRLPTSRSQSPKYPIPMRLLWFRASHIQQPKVSTLLHRFGNEGMQIQVIESNDVPNELTNGLTCELIVLECINTVAQDMLDRLSTVRANSQVPLIILTDNHTLDWSLIALRDGADAIFTLNTPDDIIIARSNALLRRWIPG